MSITTVQMLGSAILLSASLTDAQQSVRIHRIGYLALAGPTGTKPFLQGLKNLGYIEGHNVIIDYRWADGRQDRLPVLAAELVSLKPSVVVAAGSPAALAVRQLTTQTPIVIPDSADPVGRGLVKSLAQPGGNITGLTIMAPQLGGKRLELLKEALPALSQVAVVTRAPNPDKITEIKEMEAAARRLGIHVQIVATTREAGEIEHLFSVLMRKRVQAFVLIPSPTFTYHRSALVALATRNQLPAMYPNKRFVEAGGLMSYASNNADLFRRAASFVDKILKGANPAELPMEGPTKFELVINLDAAKKLGATIAPEILLEASEVIQ